MRGLFVVLALLFIVCISIYYLFRPARQIARIYTGNYSICLQPFDDISGNQVEEVYLKMKKVLPSLKLSKSQPLPISAWYKLRNRYRADSLIRWLSLKGGDSVIYIGITSKDISCSKGNIVDWGVMGLGFQPGFGCVVSTFRLKKNNLNDELYKLCLHEMGHNLGLKHCAKEYCYMRDAEGQNHLDEETCFCEECSVILSNRGVHL